MVILFTETIINIKAGGGSWKISVEFRGLDSDWWESDTIPSKHALKLRLVVMYIPKSGTQFLKLGFTACVFSIKTI